MILPNIASLSQNDDRWRRKHLGTSSITIGTSGCLLCSACVCLRFYGKDILPDQLNDRMKEINGFYDGNLWIWTAVSKIYPDISHKKTIQCYNDPAPLDDIKKRLDEGHPVIVMTFVGDVTHFVTIFGYDDKGFYTCDPNKGDVVLFKDRFGDPAKYIYKIDFYEGPLTEENLPEKPQEPEIEIPVVKIENYSEKNHKILVKISPLIGEIHDFIPKWQKELESANRKVNNLEAKIITIDEERKNFQRLYKDKLDNDISKATGRQILSTLISRFFHWKNG